MSSAPPTSRSSGALRLTVAVCTHNPKPAVLARTLAALRAQSLPTAYWELLLVDNDSTNGAPAAADLAWHPHARRLHEPVLGIVGEDAAGSSGFHMTSVRNASPRPADAGVLLEHVRATFGASHIVVTGYYPVITAASEVMAALDRLAAMQGDFIKITENTLTPALYRYALQEATRRGFRTPTHILHHDALDHLAGVAERVAVRRERGGDPRPQVVDRRRHDREREHRAVVPREPRPGD